MNPLLELQESLDAALAWRRLELSVVRQLVVTTEDSQKNVLIRAGIVLVYAHWEGFVKDCIAQYCECITKQGVRYLDMPECFLAFFIGNRAVELPMARRFRSLLTSASEIAALKSAKFDVTAKKFYSHKFWETSNLDFGTFSSLVSIIGMDAARYEVKKHLIDDALLRARHSIAHGKQHEVGEERFSSLLHEVLDLCVQLRDDVQDAADRAKFLYQNMK